MAVAVGDCNRVKRRAGRQVTELNFCCTVNYIVMCFEESEEVIKFSTALMDGIIMVENRIIYLL